MSVPTPASPTPFSPSPAANLPTHKPPLPQRSSNLVSQISFPAQLAKQKLLSPRSAGHGARQWTTRFLPVDGPSSTPGGSTLFDIKPVATSIAGVDELHRGGMLFYYCALVNAIGHGRKIHVFWSLVASIRKGALRRTRSMVIRGSFLAKRGPVRSRHNLPLGVNIRAPQHTLYYTLVLLLQDGCSSTDSSLQRTRCPVPLLPTALLPTALLHGTWSSSAAVAALRYVMKDNHTKYHMLYNDVQWHNHINHHALGLHVLGASGIL